jgi:hypothetical protein
VTVLLAKGNANVTLYKAHFLYTVVSIAAGKLLINYKSAIICYSYMVIHSILTENMRHFRLIKLFLGTFFYNTDMGDFSLPFQIFNFSFIMIGSFFKALMQNY